MTLHVFQFDGEFRRETVIAHSKKDARAVVREEGTECHPRETRGFVELDDAQLFKLYTEGEPLKNGWPSNDGWTKVAGVAGDVWCSKRPCAEWVQLAGRGQLAGPMIFWERSDPKKYLAVVEKAES